MKWLRYTLHEEFKKPLFLAELENRQQSAPNERTFPTAVSIGNVEVGSGGGGSDIRLCRGEDICEKSVQSVTSDLQPGYEVRCIFYFPLEQL